MDTSLVAPASASAPPPCGADVSLLAALDRTRAFNAGSIDVAHECFHEADA